MFYHSPHHSLQRSLSSDLGAPPPPLSFSLPLLLPCCFPSRVLTSSFSLIRRKTAACRNYCLQVPLIQRLLQDPTVPRGRFCPSSALGSGLPHFHCQPCVPTAMAWAVPTAVLALSNTSLHAGHWAGKAAPAALPFSPVAQLPGRHGSPQASPRWQQPQWPRCLPTPGENLPVRCFDFLLKCVITEALPT